MRRSLEKQLVLSCATMHMSEEKTDQVRGILSGKLDWNYILGYRGFTSMSPLLFYNLRKIAGRNSIPYFAIDRLRSRYLEVLRNNTRIYKEAREALQELQNRNIPFILLKGIVLAKTVYPDIALRPMGDIDILVGEEHLPSSVEVLTELGYVSQHEDRFFYSEHHHIQPYRKSDSHTVIEIHRHIVSEPLLPVIDITCLWEDTQVLDLDGIRVLALSAENLLLHLCLHLATNIFVNGLKTLVDISESIKHYGKSFGWNSFVRRSNDLGVGSSVYYPLWLAEEMMDTDVPASVLNGLKVEPNLSYPEVRLLKTLIKRGVSRASSHRSLPAHFVTILHKTICGELLWTPGIGRRIKRSGEDWVYGLRKFYHEYIKKDYKLRPIRMRTIGNGKKNLD